MDQEEQMNRHEYCHALLDSLSDFVDGTLSEDLCTELERHLATCQDCQIVVDTLKKTVYLYHAANEEPSVPTEVRDRLYQRLDLDDYLK